MAKVFLDSTETAFTVDNSNVTVFGAAGDQAVTIADGLTNVMVDQAVERVIFAGASSDYLFVQSAAVLRVYAAAGGPALAIIPVQADANGTQLTFTDGTANAMLTGTVMTLGGTTLDTVAPTAITPATIDPTMTTTGAIAPMSIALTTGMDSAIGAAGNDTIVGQINGVSDTFTLGDTINGNGGTDTLKLAVTGTVSNVDLAYATISNIENFVLLNGSQDLTNISIDNNAFQSVTLKGMANDVSVDNILASTAVSVQGAKAIYSNTNVNAADATSTSVTINDTFTGTGIHSNDAFVTFNNDLTKATTVNATLTAANMNADSTGYGWAEQYITTAAANAHITSNVLISGATSDGSDYSGADVYIQHDGTAAVTLNATIQNSDSVYLDVYADDNGAATGAPTGVANLTLNNVTDSYGSSEVYLADFATVNVNVTGNTEMSELATYSTTNATNDYANQTVNIVANADLKLGTLDTADYATGAVAVNVSGTGNVDLGYWDGTYSALSATATTKLDASALTGNLTVEVGDHITSLTSGSGNDQITLNVAEFGAVATGAGNDTVTLLQAPTAGTSIDAGTGTDTLVATDAILNGIAVDTTATKVAISNFEALEVTTALTADIDTTKIQAGINTVTLDTDAGTGVLTFATGASTLNLKAQVSAINVASAGTGIADSVTIVNATPSVPVGSPAVATSQDAFNYGNVTAAGVETLTLNGTGTGAAALQNVGDITVTGTGTVPASTTVKFVGTNGFSTGAITANTVDASGLTGTAGLSATTSALTVIGGAGANTLTVTAATLAAVPDNPATVANEFVAAQNATITTGAGNDTINVLTTGTGATTVNSGAGNDIINFTGDITAGAGDATINMGAGNDTFNLITHGAGKLFLNLGDGNDSFTVTAGQAINATDVIDGGAGTDTLQLQYVGSANVAAFKNFELFDVKGLDHNLDMAILNTNNAVTEIVASGAVFNSNALLTNLGAGVNFRALADMGATPLTLTQATGGAMTVTLDTAKASLTDASTPTLNVIATNATALTATLHVGSTFDAANANSMTVTATTATALTANFASDSAHTTAADNIQTINLISGGATGAATSLTVNSGGTNASNVLTYLDGTTTNHLAGITVTGSQDLDLTHLTASTSLTSINAATFTGHLAVDIADLKAGAGTITLGLGADTVNVSAFSNATSWESIASFGKAAAAAFGTDATAAAAAIAAADQFVTGAGVAVAADNAAGAGFTISHGVMTFTGAGPANFAAALTLADGATSAAAGTAVEFQYLNDSYVFVQDGTAGATAADGLIKLVGTTGITHLAEVGSTTHFIIG